jgi:hypothetical protein
VNGGRSAVQVEPTPDRDVLKVDPGQPDKLESVRSENGHVIMVLLAKYKHQFDINPSDCVGNASATSETGQTADN